MSGNEELTTTETISKKNFEMKIINLLSNRTEYQKLMPVKK